jgi:hypothetical protein
MRFGMATQGRAGLMVLPEQKQSHPQINADERRLKAPENYRSRRCGRIKWPLQSASLQNGMSEREREDVHAASSIMARTFGKI